MSGTFSRLKNANMLRRIAALLLLSIALGCANEPYKYRGHEIRYRLREFSILSGYELRPEYVPVVARLIRTADVPASFASGDAYVHQLFELKVPSYGLSSLQRRQSDGTIVSLDCVEIPDIARDRCFAYRRTSSGRYERVDDFIVNTQHFAIADFVVGSSWVTYCDPNSRQLFTHRF